MSNPLSIPVDLINWYSINKSYLNGNLSTQELLNHINKLPGKARSNAIKAIQKELPKRKRTTRYASNKQII